MRCCIGDGGASRTGWWSALQGEVANHRKLLRSRAVVVSVCGEVAPVSAAGVGHEGERKRTADDVSKGKQDDIETGRNREPGKEPGGSLLIGQVVSGMEVARAWPGLRCGTCEPVGPRWGGRPVVQGSGPRPVAWSENPKRLKPRGGE
jgi:hypothetical protein